MGKVEIEEFLTSLATKIESLPPLRTKLLVRFLFLYKVPTTQKKLQKAGLFEKKVYKVRI